MSTSSTYVRPDCRSSAEHDPSRVVLQHRLQRLATPQRHQSQCDRNDASRAASLARASAQVDSSLDSALGVKLDKNLFQHFWPLLDDCRDYARLRGCRFRSRSWDGLTGDVSKRQRTRRTDARTAETAMVDKARAEAAPTVYRFAKRLRDGEVELLDEVDRASRIVSVESVRSAMIATCQRLDLWPPVQSQTHVSEDDYRFEDICAPVPTIAQRLYNDEKRRQSFAGGTDDPDPIRRRAMMAMFITEFATAVGVTKTETARTYEGLLVDFMAKATVWERTMDVQDGENEVTSAHEESNSKLLGAYVPDRFATKAMSALDAVPKFIRSINQIGRS